MKPVTMHELGDKLADLHLSTKHDAVHKGRYGFVADNFLSRTPVVNEWESEWHVFFAQRLKGQLDFAFVDKVRLGFRVEGLGAFVDKVR